MSLKKSSETAKEAGLLGKANIVATITYLLDVLFNSQNRNGAFKFHRNQVVHHACNKIKIFNKKTLVWKYYADRLKIYSCMAWIRHDQTIWTFGLKVRWV